MVPHTRCAMAQRTEEELHRRVSESAGVGRQLAALPRRRRPARGAARRRPAGALAPADPRPGQGRRLPLRRRHRPPDPAGVAPTRRRRSMRGRCRGPFGLAPVSGRGVNSGLRSWRSSRVPGVMRCWCSHKKTEVAHPGATGAGDPHMRVRSAVGVPAALIPVGASVSHPKERLDGHAWVTYPCGAI